MDPVLYPYLDLLPTDSMPWQRLEQLLRQIHLDVEGLRDVQIYGVSGQAQYGIDVVGTAVDGSRHAIQGKRYQKFTKADLTTAVNTFMAKRGAIPFPISRFIVAAGCLADRTEITEELYRLQQAHPDVRIELWHQRTIADKLRNRHDIVVPFFGDDIAKKFCLPTPPHVVSASPLDRVDLADALVHGPAKITGADTHLAEADRLDNTDPRAASDQVEQAAQLLADGGFAAHASVLLPRRATLLVRAGEYDSGSRALSDAFWQAMTVYDDSAVDALARQLKTITETETSRALAHIAEIALNLVRHPIDASPEIPLGELREQSETRLELGRLLLLLAQNSAIDPDGDWRRSHIGELRSHADTVADHGEDGAELACRLRIEAADVSGEWTELLDSARRHRLPRHQTVLIFARHALHHAERGESDMAAQSWEDATTQACLDRQNDAAAEYVFSRRILNVRFDGLVRSDDVQLVRSLRALGDHGARAAEQLEEKAMRALLENKPHVAVPLLRAFHRAAHSSGAWGQLTRARELLADTYSETHEEQLAARLFALAGLPKKAATLAKKDPNRYLDVYPCVSHPAYWVAAVGYRMLAEQADVLPDDQVAAVSDSALAVLDDAQAGTLRDSSFFAPSVVLSAVKALASLAERLPPDHAQRLLDHTRPWVSREPNKYRHTDDDHVRACVGIATAHPSLRADAVEQLMGLLAANDSGVSARVEREARDLVQNHPELVHDKLAALAGQRNDYAARLLRLITEEPSAEQMTAAAAAAVRLRKPPDSTAESIGIGTGAPDDALLAIPLPGAERRDLARTQLQHARAPYEPSRNRAEYFEAARILAHDLDDVDDLFDEAILLASERSSSLGDVGLNLGSHPLSTFRTIGMTTDTRPDALFLGACLARTQEQRHRVRDIAYSLIGSSDGADWYVTRALQILDTVDDHDVPFLATQPHWALRSLAAIAWARSTAAADIGRLLAQDDDPRVRRALAEAVNSSPTNEAAEELRELLTTDPCHSVRKRARGAPGT
jgi:hypothetical protein